MTHWHTLVSNSETISAADLGASQPTVTIESVTGGVFEDEGGKKDKKALVAFVGHEKKFAANTINCTLLEALFGPEVENWAGHKITLKADTVEVRGHLYGKPCIRVAGSPELEKSIQVTIALPRRKPFARTLVPTKANVASKASRLPQDATDGPTASGNPNGQPDVESGFFGGEAP